MIQTGAGAHVSDDNEVDAFEREQDWGDWEYRDLLQSQSDRHYCEWATQSNTEMMSGALNKYFRTIWRRGDPSCTS